MGLRVATNVQSIAAQRSLNINTDQQKNALEKLASGSRITKASDDAAGLAIAEKMRGQIRSVRQDQRNAQDGISMIQTTEGALNEVTNILIRFRELSIQAASDTIGDSERGFIDKEVQQLKQEVDRISNATEYNGQRLLAAGGDKGTLEIQIGLNNDPTQDRFVFDTNKVAVSTETLGLSDASTLSKENAQNNLAAVDEAIKRVTENRSELGALQNRLNSSIANMQVYDENLSAARSRIADLDVANGTAELTKYNILAQASTSVLSQANQNNMLAMRLLG